MTARTIAHSLFSWTEGGVARLATHGETVEIDDDVIAAYERHGVFEADDVEPVEAVPEPAVIEKVTPPATVKPVPRAASDKAAWVEYAAAVGLHFSPDTDKQHIIDAVTAHTEGDDRA